MLYYRNLKNKVLSINPEEHIDNFTVISGYISADPIRELEHFPEDVHSTIIYGMYGSENIKAQLHASLISLQRDLPNVDILYSTIPVHSKIYLWNKNQQIQRALMGSANFSTSGLCNDYKEVLSDVDQGIFSQVQEYSEYVKSYCINCTDHVERAIEHRRRIQQYGIQPFVSQGICRASLLDRSGNVPAMSGLNWGLSNGHVCEGDAYIRITKDYLSLFPRLFPTKKYVNGLINPSDIGRANRENDEIELIWDDGTVMVGLLEGQQTGPIPGMLYPKQLCSSPRKNILGYYLRGRLGLSPDHTITRSDLEQYGRAYIDISLIGDGVYYMDFSNGR